MLTTKEISEKLQVSEETVRRWIRTKQLEAMQEGKSYYVDPEKLETFIREQALIPGTSLSKMKNLVAGAIAHPKTRDVAFDFLTKGLGQFIKGSNDSTKMDASKTVEDLKDHIETLVRQKKKLELEYQIKILEIDEEISKYEKLIKEVK